MFQLILWSLVVLAIVGGIVFLVLRTKSRSKPELTIREAIVAARKALKNQQEWPKLFRFNQDEQDFELIAYDAIRKEDLNHPGLYRLVWPHLDLRYTIQAMSEEVRLELKSQEKHVSLLYLQGVLESLSLGHEVFDREQFDMRHAGNFADQLRKVLRQQLCSGYGTHERKKLVEEGSAIQVNQAGEIKLSEIPARKG